MIFSSFCTAQNRPGTIRHLRLWLRPLQLLAIGSAGSAWPVQVTIQATTLGISGFDLAGKLTLPTLRGAVAEWTQALLLREKINVNQKIPGSPPGLGNL